MGLLGTMLSVGGGSTIAQGIHVEGPDATIRMYLVYLECWTLNLMPLIIEWSTLEYYSIQCFASKVEGRSSAG